MVWILALNAKLPRGRWILSYPRCTEDYGTSSGSEVRRKRATDGALACVRFRYAQVKRRAVVVELSLRFAALAALVMCPWLFEDILDDFSLAQNHSVGALIRNVFGPALGRANLLTDSPCLLWGLSKESPAVAPRSSGFAPRR